MSAKLQVLWHCGLPTGPGCRHPSVLVLCSWRTFSFICTDRIIPYFNGRMFFLRSYVTTATNRQGGAAVAVLLYSQPEGHLHHAVTHLPLSSYLNLTSLLLPFLSPYSLSVSLLLQLKAFNLPPSLSLSLSLSLSCP
jgi:hypothetical protein